MRVGSYPNPSIDGKATLFFEVKGDAAAAAAAGDVHVNVAQAKVRLALYTVSKRLIWERTLTGVEIGMNRFDWDGRDLWGKALGNGTYIYTVTAEIDGERTHKTSQIMILR